jgi:hypothetical protein
MARSPCSNQRSDTLMQDRSPLTRRNLLATHGRTIHWVKSGPTATSAAMSGLPKSGRESDLRVPGLASAPALSERSHRLLARQLVAVRRSWYVAVVAARPHPGAALRPDCIVAEDAADHDAPFGALNDVVEKRKSRVVWYPVERHVNVHPMMAASAEELASQGL